VTACSVVNDTTEPRAPHTLAQDDWHFGSIRRLHYRASRLHASETSRLPTIQAYADAERLSTNASKPQTVSVKEVRACGIWGNPRLAFVTAHASYDAETTLGDTRVVLVLRKVSSAWRLLAAARDPITTGQFVKELPSAVAGLARRERNAAVPAPAIL